VQDRFSQNASHGVCRQSIKQNVMRAHKRASRPGTRSVLSRNRAEALPLRRRAARRQCRKEFLLQLPHWAPTPPPRRKQRQTHHRSRNAPGRRRSSFHTLAQGVERKRAEEALTSARSELAHMARVTTLSALTASIAHEISQPIFAVVTKTDACLRWLNRDSTLPQI
jgi:C4-dicarboxylate-specific signal transduction histidine kinase